MCNTCLVPIGLRTPIGTIPHFNRIDRKQIPIDQNYFWDHDRSVDREDVTENKIGSAPFLASRRYTTHREIESVIWGYPERSAVLQRMRRSDLSFRGPLKVTFVRLGKERCLSKTESDRICTHLRMTKLYIAWDDRICHFGDHIRVGTGSVISGST
jgi:hypothetical protein